MTVGSGAQMDGHEDGREDTRDGRKDGEGGQEGSREDSRDGRRDGAPGRFIALTVALSVPFWLAGAVAGQLTEELPVSALMAVCPGLAAVILVAREGAPGGVRRLLARAFDAGRIRDKVWYVPAVLVMPAIMVLSYLVMRFAGAPLPEPEISLLAIPLLVVVFFVMAVCEELGWMAYAYDPMRSRWGALASGVILGVVWGVWHVIPYMQAGRGPGWIVWQCVFSAALRVIIVWVYDNAGRSVFAASLCHASSNVAWTLFPNNGSHYDPAVTGVIAVAVAVLVALFWRARTLSPSRMPEPGATG
ncbi:lysostaphin resistance A-like protein [Nonomuraea sp. NPDC048916]|uniref:CPBP family intramembrane glutamic endopeptidase n=1 Tax=Nonomuraea sp. NPDC048916 TaxID=3154232 RepID=UPI0033DC6A6F